MRVYALTSTQVAGETLDLFLTQDAAEAELREILEDEPRMGERAARYANRSSAGDVGELGLVD